MPRLRVVDVSVTILVVSRRLRSASLYRNAMLVTNHAIGVVERFARVRAGVEIGLAASRIAFVVGISYGLRPSGRRDHASASGWSA
jgi:hypothetical protein